MSEQIFIQNGNERVELTGQALEDFLTDRAQMQAETNARKTMEDINIITKESALTKLQALGLTEDEIKALVGA
jgi:hypothetical protein